MLSDPELDSLATLAHRLADAAGAVSLEHFRSEDLAADNKAGGGAFDPVTAADRAAEAAIREILARERPDDAIFGEEQGRSSGKTGFAWIIDPIDGTRSFLAGTPTWGTLIALDDGERGRIGIVDQPFTGERFTGLNREHRGEASLSHHGATRPIRTRLGVSLVDAILFTTAPEMFEPAELAAFEAVKSRARLARYGLDCYAYALLAMGQVDLVIEAGLEAYDIAAPAALIIAAGGVVTDWQGGDCRHGGRVLAAGNASLHREALALLSDHPVNDA